MVQRSGPRHRRVAVRPADVRADERATGRTARPTRSDRDDARVLADLEGTPKIVFSSPLDSVEGNARLVRGGDVAEELARVREEFPGDLDVGGATLAASFIRRGLVDEYRAGRPPGRARPDAVLPAAREPSASATETHRFASGRGTRATNGLSEDDPAAPARAGRNAASTARVRNGKSRERAPAAASARRFRGVSATNEDRRGRTTVAPSCQLAIESCVSSMTVSASMPARQPSRRSTASHARRSPGSGNGTSVCHRRLGCELPSERRAAWYEPRLESRRPPVQADTELQTSDGRDRSDVLRSEGPLPSTLGSRRETPAT